jgi:glycine/D-amino acid oxidase-like deaminating enzyme
MPARRTVLVLGAGIVAMGCAWLLQRRGHAVTLVAADYDEPLLPPRGACGGSRAALGVLMGNLFQRRNGRAWRLRQRSLALWPRWRQELAARGHVVPWRPGVLLLAADAAERQRLERLQPLGLRLLEPDSLAALLPALPGSDPTGSHPTGSGHLQAGLFSPADGQIDPLAALAALRSDALAAGMVGRAGVAGAPQQHNGAWQLQLSGGEILQAQWLVLAAGCGSGALTEPPLEPVLGQALELELDAVDAADAADAALWRGWPGAVVWRGMNLVPRPDLPGGRRFWLGATLEPGRTADAAALAGLRALQGDAPAWLQRARVVRHWHGLRPRPVGRPAPLLEEPAPGLLLVGGHYRNGVLLTPASAEWVCGRIEGVAVEGVAGGGIQP